MHGADLCRTIEPVFSLSAKGSEIQNDCCSQNSAELSFPVIVPYSTSIKWDMSW